MSNEKNTSLHLSSDVITRRTLSDTACSVVLLTDRGESFITKPLLEEPLEALFFKEELAVAEQRKR